METCYFLAFQDVLQASYSGTCVNKGMIIALKYLSVWSL